MCTLTAQEIAIQIKSLRAQLDVLEARLKEGPSAAQEHTLADLYGALSGQSETSAEEIDQVLYRELGLP